MLLLISEFNLLFMSYFSDKSQENPKIIVSLLSYLFWKKKPKT